MWRVIAGSIATSFGNSYAKTLAFIVFVLPMIIGMIIKILGIAFIVYAGSEYFMGYAETLIFSKFQGLPTVLVKILNLMGISTAIQMILSSATAVLTLKAFGRERKFKFLA